MATPDGPRFLTDRPVAPPPPTIVRAVPPPRPPRKLAPLSKRKRTELDNKPSWLARSLGPGRMPRVMMRFPRLCGIAFLAMGIWSWDALGPKTRVDVETGLVIISRSRSGPILAMIGLFLGLFLVIAGRPRDERGYSPEWWNYTYVGICFAAGIAALIVRSTI